MQVSSCKVAGSSLERLRQWLVGPVGRPLPLGGVDPLRRATRLLRGRASL